MKSILNQILIAVASALVLGALAFVWNWATDGSLAKAIAAATQEELKTMQYDIEDLTGQMSLAVGSCRVCFRETENSNQCQGSKNTCSGWSTTNNVGDWSNEFRDDTDGRAGGCKYQWRLECRPIVEN